MKPNIPSDSEGINGEAIAGSLSGNVSNSRNSHIYENDCKKNLILVSPNNVHIADNIWRFLLCN